MTVVSYIAVSLSVLLAGGWLGCIYLINQYAGYPFWVAVQQLFWPVGILSFLILLGGVQAQVSYWTKKRRGVAKQDLPETVPIEMFLLVPALITILVSAGWLYILFTEFTWAGAKQTMGTPLLLIAISLLIFLIYGLIEWRRKKK